MFRLRTTVLAALVLAATLPLTAGAADDESKLIGLWQEEMDGYKVVWSIGYWNGKWSVTAAMTKPGEKKGYWTGADVRFADGKLTFTQKRGPDAPMMVADDTKVIVQPFMEGELTCTTDKGRRSLKRTLEVGFAPEPLLGGGEKTAVADAGKPDPNPVKPNGGNVPMPKPGDKPADKPEADVVIKPPEDAKKFAGVWLGDGEVDGFREIWTIKIGEDKAAVTRTFFDPKGKRAPCYIFGDKVRFEKGKLVFNEKMSPNCPRHWNRGGKITAEADLKSLSYSYFGGGRELTRLPQSVIEAAYVGTWAGEIDGLAEVVIIRKVGTRWQIGAKLLRGDRLVSSWKGQDVKFADGKLTFTQKLGLPAPAGWMDKSQYTLEWDGFSLVATWVNGDKTGEPRQLNK